MRYGDMDRGLGPGTLMAPIALRPATPDDDAFLFQVFRTARERQDVHLPLAPVEKIQFFEMQFAAQRRQYQEQFPTLQRSMVLNNDRPAGFVLSNRSGK